MIDQQKISIGLPIFNASGFLQKRITNILSMNFQEFELIISDNCSTDSSKKICQEFMKKDSRIKFYQQEKNVGAHENFKFVLEKAQSEFFIWTAASDIWDNTFLEKNLQTLLKNPNLVGCISKMITYGGQREERMISKKTFVNKIIKNTRKYFSKYGTFSIKGNYDERIRKCLKIRSGENIYGLYKTDAIKKSWIDDSISAVDLGIILNLLKYGEIHRIDEELFQDYAKGLSSKGIITTYRNIRKSKIEYYLPYYSFTKWAYKTLGKKIFFKNLDNFFNMNLGGFLAVIYDIILIERKKIIA